MTDREKKQIVADYVECENYSEVGRKHGVSHNTVRRVVREHPDAYNFIQQKKEQNTRDILAYMDGKSAQVCHLIDRYLEALMDEKKVQQTALQQLATVMGIVIDKFTKAKELERPSAAVTFQILPASQAPKEEDAAP